MDSFSTAFAREVAKRIDEAIALERNTLDMGAAVKTIEEYREHVGRLYAYRQVLLDFMPDAEADVQNPPAQTGAR